MSTIYAVEGPSGSGKSLWLRQQSADRSNAILLERPVFPRYLDNWVGAWSSSFLEYQAISAAVMSQQDVVVDRFLLSRIVYRAMQFSSNKLTNNWYDEIARSWRRLKTMAVAEAWDRMGISVYLHPTVELTVLMPSEYILEQQRAETGKLYPFSGRMELQLYDIVTDKLIREPLSGVKISLKA